VKDETLWAEGEEVDVTATPKTGYTFSGWASSDKGGSFAAASDTSTTYTFGPSAGLGTTTLTAEATPVSYKVAFDKNSTDATGFMADEDMTYDAEKALSANAFSRAGYTFSGWNTASDGSGTPYADKASVENLSSTDGATVTLFAQWAENGPVTISYVSADAAKGTVSPASESVAPATGAPSATATPAAGYHFVSWTDADGNVVGTAAHLAPAKPAGGAYVAATYTADFAPNAYTVAFDPNGGTGTMAPQAMAYGTPAALAANALSRTNWAFAGWNTKADGSGTAYADAATVSDLATEDGATVTLCAQWRPAQAQARTFAVGGVEVTATLTGSAESIDDLVVERRASASDVVASALGGRTLQGDWDVYFTDGRTSGFGTLELAFPATGERVQVLEVHSGRLAEGDVQEVSGGTVTASVTTLSEFAVVSAPEGSATVSPAASVSATTATPATGDGAPAGAACALALAGLAALALARRLPARP
jgi:uncharacterized repeat protein (TIGR02543 family)